ncbi:MAG TPA: ABC transporter substrate-binding protein, partial [Pyrinomonadaceae bacterium]|nr:ABC transporter substrate-binding protein [Pyrinomonadaceae bacterium]
MFLRYIFAFLLIFSTLFFTFSCRTQSRDALNIALGDKFSGLDTISTVQSDAAADRIRNLMFNSLVEKNEKFEYVGELAKDIKIDAENLTVTFVLHDNVKFHNGKDLTSADAKYTLSALFDKGGYKAASFYDTVGGQKQYHITSMETPDAKTLVLKVSRPALINQTLSNLVTIPIIPEGTIDQQKTSPIGTGAFKFAAFDQANSAVSLEANPNYWEGAPKIQKVNVRTVTDANALQAELQAGRVDLVPNPTNISADTYNTLGKNPNLQIVQMDGSNIRYIGFNVTEKPVDNIKIRQAIAYAIDREKILRDLLSGQGKVAHSILPEASWAYSAPVKYNYDPAKAKQLLQEAGYKGEPITFKFLSGSSAVSLYSQVIQDSLKAVGINVEIATLEENTLRDQLKQGQFQMTTAQWIGGNQDPIFLRDLFDSDEFPDKKPNARNRSRYANAEFDKIVREAVNTTDKAKAAQLYARAQEIVANDLPYLPLWYPANMVIASKRLDNIKNVSINASGDWSFVKDLTV